MPVLHRYSAGAVHAKRAALLVVLLVVIVGTLYGALFRGSGTSAETVEEWQESSLNRRADERLGHSPETTYVVSHVPAATALTPAPLNQPTAHKVVNGVILFLAGGRWDSYFVRECLPRLERYFLKCHPYPVRIFHEQLPMEQRGTISSKIPSATRVHFEDVSAIWKRLPNGVSEGQLQTWMNTGLQRKFQGRGYRIMCRFWHGLVWRLPSMKQYDYYWRLDTDSILTEPVRVDPFVTLSQRGCDYGFNRLKGENPYVAVHLWTTFLSFAKSPAVPVAYQRNRDQWLAAMTNFALDPQTGEYWAPMYYNNFELGSMRLKVHPLYDAWFEFVDTRAPFGIFQYRWGDAPLHTLGVMAVLYAEGWRACNFTKADVGYRHAAAKPGPILPLNCTIE